MLGLGVNTRVLMIGAHPDDEDTNLITWLSRGRHVSTAYLSLTRGDGGQNVIGNELGEALGVLRTEELLAARRIDGALQYFTRAYDFGFSKDTLDTYAHWPRDTLLGDVVRVVRAFRPHVIIAVFSGTPRDGHGQHQVSGLLARAAYDIAGDTTRYSTAGFGPPWTPLKFYRAARGNAREGTLGVDVGEYSPLLGESYGEIAGRSRSQHKSQGFGALQRKGPIMNYVRREATRVNVAMAATSERSIFDGIDTTWARFRPHVRNPQRRDAIDSLPWAFAEAQQAFDPFRPEALVPHLRRIGDLLGWLCTGISQQPCAGAPDRDAQVEADLSASVAVATGRVARAASAASGLSIDALAPREVVAVGTRTPVGITIYNERTDTVTVIGPLQQQMSRLPGPRKIPPSGMLLDSTMITVGAIAQPSWLERGRRGAMFITSASDGLPAQDVAYLVRLENGESLTLESPVEFRYADDVRGEIRRPVAAVPRISITLDQATQYVPANTDIDRRFAVTLRSANLQPDTARVSLLLPAGLMADSASRTVIFSRYDETRTLTFRVRGRLKAGRHALTAIAVAHADTFRIGYTVIDYDHIRRQRIYGPASVTFTAADIRVPAGLRVGYLRGVSDNVAPTLQQLGIPVTILSADDVGQTDLSRFSTVVIGPRAYETHPELVSANPKLLDFARRGGTLVVQYGQYEMTRPGIMPYPITISRPHDRVTHEEAPVTIVDENATVLRSPNRITQQDFASWVQERSLYMPRTFDDHYRPVIAISDPGEPLNRGSILVAPIGRGTYVYTTLAFFRQLPAGVPGAARLFVNLLSAGLSAPPVP